MAETRCASTLAGIRCVRPAGHKVAASSSWWIPARVDEFHHDGSREFWSQAAEDPKPSSSDEDGDYDVQPDEHGHLRLILKSSSSRMHESHEWGPVEGGDEVDPIRHCKRCGTSTTDEDVREEHPCKSCGIGEGSDA